MPKCQIEKCEIWDEEGAAYGVNAAVANAWHTISGAKTAAVSGYVEIGFDRDIADYLWTGYISEVICYSGQLTLAQEKTIYDYLMEIPFQIGHPIRLKSATDSEANRPGIPFQIGHPFEG